MSVELPMSYDSKSQKTLEVVKAMEDALGANSNDMDQYFHKEFPLDGQPGLRHKKQP